ncbi:MAG: hemin uptake protein HemP [Parasulfuritortus sp.]|jgi:hemin uptake protein HemP|nr:hemin uptake protein HemP [Parasulfuritortus sp.]
MVLINILSMLKTSQTKSVSPDAKPANEPVVVESGCLFGSNRVVVIKHQGEQYRLSLTKQGKLILTK